MSRAEKMRASRGAYVVRWREFLIAQERDNTALHCFVEGGDEKYLGLRVRLLTNRERVIFYPCDGKDGVFAALRLSADARWDSALIAFFVDRDFGCAEAPPLEYEALYYALLFN